MRRFFEAEVLRDVAFAEVSPVKGVDDEKAIAKYLGEVVNASSAHMSGTCAAGRREWGAVVDTRFRVHGVSGLRVVDASVMPLVPATHLCSTVYALAEKVGFLGWVVRGLG